MIDQIMIVIFIRYLKVCRFYFFINGIMNFAAYNFTKSSNKNSLQAALYKCFIVLEETS